MALREVVVLGGNGADVLRKRARRVNTFDAKLHQIVDDMVETLLDAPGVGLAAPQIGLSLRIITVRLPDDETDISS